ncbi:hypothetical protein E2562_017695 [Oryza meyeriana var. granulata]|uniref:Uncharacterized protein n=1 Tax=Oryza meyeriana var. granulata TaxID=110450 RepID=A0A6G1BYE3_9ORYZ|nr:hypothetical protein E2562_017695 [Oryza meyeriana var. granulata]
MAGVAIDREGDGQDAAILFGETGQKAPKILGDVAEATVNGTNWSALSRHQRWRVIAKETGRMRRRSRGGMRQDDDGAEGVKAVSMGGHG